MFGLLVVYLQRYGEFNCSTYIQYFRVKMLNMREFFCGKEVEGTNAPFQKDQCDKIFKVLGVPTPKVWPGVDRLPEYKHVQAMMREKKYPVTSELKKAVHFGSSKASHQLYDLLSRMMDMSTFSKMQSSL